ncbi:MAG: hypothetical protein JO099_19025, partial [Acidobacteriia bacterium]|nr:hypothetical protein [Terriglobia bacterium]
MSRRNILTTIVLGPALFAAALPADTVFVSAVSSGLWSNPNIWSPAVVPNDSDGTNYDVVVASPLRSMNGPSVTVDINPTVDTLNVGPYFGNLDVASGSTLKTGLLGVGFGSRMTVDGTLNVGGSSAEVPSSTLTIAATGAANFADFSDSLIINNEGVLNIVNLSKGSTEEITNIGILNITNS